MNNKSSDNKNLLRNIIHRKVSPSQLLILMEIRDHPGRMSREIATRCHLIPAMCLTGWIIWCRPAT